VNCSPRSNRGLEGGVSVKCRLWGLNSMTDGRTRVCCMLLALRPGLIITVYILRNHSPPSLSCRLQGVSVFPARIQSSTPWHACITAVVSDYSWYFPRFNFFCKSNRKIFKSNCKWNRSVSNWIFTSQIESPNGSNRDLNPNHDLDLPITDTYSKIQWLHKHLYMVIANSCILNNNYMYLDSTKSTNSSFLAGLQ